jgi:hypothetical protein
MDRCDAQKDRQSLDNYAKHIPVVFIRKFYILKLAQGYFHSSHREMKPHHPCFGGGM